MEKLDNFKNFVKKNPELITNVKNEKMTWQKYYELYDLYGEDENVWNSYILKDKSSERGNNSTTSKFNELMDMAKNIDVDKVQNGISSLQKAIGLFGDLFVSKNSNNSVGNNNSYTPRPIYRKFDD